MGINNPTGAIASGDLWKKFGKAVLLLIISAVALFIFVRTAWMCDDAYITLRTVDNFVNGYGLTWNTTERVQSYTHPLWMMVLSIFYATTHDAYFMPIILSMMLSLSAILLLGVKPISENSLNFLLAATVLLFSKAFIDYATSGLENPLSYLLSAAFLAVYFSSMEIKQKVFVSTLVASLIALNRLDLLLIVFPPLVYLYIKLARSERRWILCLAKALLVGFLPLIAWTIFSLVYYGFPFPNTYYAKIHTGIPLPLLIQQGIHYFLASAVFDPITMIFIAVAIVFAFISRRWDRITVSIGLILYGLYLIRIGGDFMLGRFFAVPLVFSVALIANTKQPRFSAIALLAAALVVGLTASDPTLFSDEKICFRNDGSHKRHDEMVDSTGVCNERVFYYRTNGLLINIMKSDWAEGLAHALGNRGFSPPRRYGRINAYPVAIAGFRGFQQGPHVHAVDIHALSDPLLARLPVQSMSWHIGHFRRKIPQGYMASLETGENRIENRYLAEYYERIRLITRGDLFSPERLVAIWEINTGACDHLIEKYLNNASLNEVGKTAPDGANVEHPLTRIITDEGLKIEFERRFRKTRINIGLDGNDEYRLDYLLDGDVIATQTIKPSGDESGIVVRNIDIPDDAIYFGFVCLKIIPEDGDGRYFIGGLTFHRDEDIVKQVRKSKKEKPD